MNNTLNNQSPLLRNLYGKLSLNLNSEQIQSIQTKIFQEEILKPICDRISQDGARKLKNFNFEEFLAFYSILKTHLVTPYFYPYKPISFVSDILNNYSKALKNAQSLNSKVMINVFSSQCEALLNCQRNCYFLDKDFPAHLQDFITPFITKNDVTSFSQLLTSACFSNRYNFDCDIFNKYFDILKIKLKEKYGEEHLNEVSDSLLLSIIHMFHENKSPNNVLFIKEKLSDKYPLVSLDKGINILNTNSQDKTFQIIINQNCFLEHFFLGYNKNYDYLVQNNYDQKINTIFLSKIVYFIKIINMDKLFESIDYSFDHNTNKLYPDLVFTIKGDIKNEESLKLLIKQSISYIYENEKIAMTGETNTFSQEDFLKFIHEYKLNNRLSDKDNISRQKHKI